MGDPLSYFLDLALSGGKAMGYLLVRDLEGMASRGLW